MTHFIHAKRRCFLLLLAVLASACAAPPARRPLAPVANKLGVHLLLDDGRAHWPPARWPDHLQAARDTVGPGGFVTQLVRLDDLDVAKWQTFMDLCAALGLTPIIRLATTYDHDAGAWVAPPVDGGLLNSARYTLVAQRYADFLAALTWPADAHFVIVGNEPNHGDEWGGQPDPAAYGRFLYDVATAVKQADPQARILNAGLDPYTPHSGGAAINGMVYLDNATFLQEMVAAEPDVLALLDAWNSHAYPLGPFAAPPWEQTFQIDVLPGAPAAPAVDFGVPNRGVNGYEWELAWLAQQGVTDLPVFITETGWRLEAAGYPDAATAALYLDLALRGNNGRYPQLPAAGWTPWQDDPRVAAVTPFALNGHPGEWGHTSWLALDEQGRLLGWRLRWPAATRP